MDAHTQKVARHITERSHISRNTAHELDEKSPLGNAQQTK